MFNTLFLFLSQIRFFWIVRRACSRLVFVSYRMLFSIQHYIWEKSTTLRTLLSLLWHILGSLILAIGIAIGLQILNPYLVPWITKLGLTIPTGSDYGTLLAAVIGVGGVFIGLYYAAISAVCGAIYARLPNNIRGLLAREQAGNAYMRSLAVLTSLAVCLLVFHALGLEPVILATLLLPLGAGLMIIGFVRLGARAFYLFDPTTLSGWLFEQLRRCYKRMRAGGYRWSDPSFQNHAHGEAQTAIDTLTTVSEIAETELHLNGHPFAGLCKHLLLFLRHYETGKKSIPTNSRWYRQRYVHSDWYRTDDTNTSLAHATAAVPQPKTVSDPRWIESAILPIVKCCLEINIEENRYNIVNALLRDLDAYLQHLAEEHQVEFTFDLMDDVFSWCKNFIFTKADKPVLEESPEHMEICERLATMPINVLLAYTRALESYEREAIRHRILRITWDSEKSIYKAGFATHVLERLEWLRSKLAFEEGAERHIVSPPWYLQELIAQQEAENLRTATICFYEKGCELYKHWIEMAKSSQHPWLVAVMILRESEYWFKIDSHANTLNQLWSDLNSDRQIEDLPWPSLDTDELTEKRNHREKELLELMSEENVLLSLISRPESYPDFAGKFLHAVGEALLTAMYENDYDMVKALFKGYFAGNQLQYSQQRPEEITSEPQIERDMKIAVAPLLDLMDISGYVYLLSDYHNAPCLKEPIIEAWDEYLNQDSVTPLLELLAGAVTLTESAFEIAHRSVNRTRWKQIIQHRLKDLERQEIYSGGGGILGGIETVVIHESPLVRIFAGEYGSLFYDGIDIFIAKYVRQREDGENLNFGRSPDRDLEEKIRREESRDTMEDKS